MFQKIHKMKSNIKRIGFIIFVGFIFASNIYQYLASNEYLGDAAMYKYLDQKESNDLGLFSGRIDFFAAIYAIAHNPIIGFGSFPKDDENYTRQFGKIVHEPRLDWELIPSHSFLFGTWVFTGILGAFFWIYMIYVLIMYIKRCFWFDYRFIAFSLLFAFEYAWDILFSPFSGSKGLKLVFIFVYFMIVLNIKTDKIKGII